MDATFSKNKRKKAYCEDLLKISSQIFGEGLEKMIEKKNSLIILICMVPKDKNLKQILGIMMNKYGIKIKKLKDRIFIFDPVNFDSNNTNSHHTMAPTSTKQPLQPKDFGTNSQIDKKVNRPFLSSNELLDKINYLNAIPKTNNTLQILYNETYLSSFTKIIQRKYDRIQTFQGMSQLTEAAKDLDKLLCINFFDDNECDKILDDAISIVQAEFIKAENVFYEQLAAKAPINELKQIMDYMVNAVDNISDKVLIPVSIEKIIEDYNDQIMQNDQKVKEIQYDEEGFINELEEVREITKNDGSKVIKLNNGSIQRITGKCKFGIHTYEKKNENFLKENKKYKEIKNAVINDGEPRGIFDNEKERIRLKSLMKGIALVSILKSSTFLNVPKTLAEIPKSPRFDIDEKNPTTNDQEFIVIEDMNERKSSNIEQNIVNNSKSPTIKKANDYSDLIERNDWKWGHSNLNISSIKSIKFAISQQDKNYENLSNQSHEKEISIEQNCAKKNEHDKDHRDIEDFFDQSKLKIDKINKVDVKSQDSVPVINDFRIASDNEMANKEDINLQKEMPKINVLNHMIPDVIEYFTYSRIQTDSSKNDSAIASWIEDRENSLKTDKLIEDLRLKKEARNLIIRDLLSKQDDLQKKVDEVTHFINGIANLLTRKKIEGTLKDAKSELEKNKKMITLEIVQLEMEAQHLESLILGENTNSTTKPDQNINFLIIGNNKSGKTSFVLSLQPITK